MLKQGPLLAAAAVLLAMAVIGLIDNFIVHVAQTHGLWQFHLFRTLIALPVMLALAWFGLGRLRPRSWGAVVLRSGAVSASMVLYFGSLAVMPIAEVAAGLFTSPIWVLLISALFLRRRVGPVRIGAALLGFAGVVLVLRPEDGGVSAVALIPVLAGLLYGIGSMLTRETCAEESALSLLAGNFGALALAGLAGLVVLGVLQPAVPDGPAGFAVRPWVMPDLRFLAWTAVQAAGSLFGVWLLIRGYQMAETSFVSVFEFSFLIFASFWAYLLHGDWLEVLEAIGIAMIIAAGVTIALRGR